MHVDSERTWRTGDLAHVGWATEVWELTTFWIGVDGAQMATLERLAGDRVVVAHVQVADLQPLG